MIPTLYGRSKVRPSCAEIFSMQIVRDAAHDAHVQLRQVEYRTQGRDHPILPAAPETQYLKCGIFQIFD